MHQASQLRKSILATRNQLTRKERESKSREIRQRLLSLEEISSGQTIFAYVSFGSEVATHELIDSLLAMEKTVVVPIIRVKEKRLDAIRITDRAADLEAGYWDIPEPKEKLCATSMVSPKAIDTIFLPGSVFDERGGRFGYGGGYYDRFLAKVPHARRIGLAFDVQIVAEAPLQEHDELLDLIVTESRMIRGNR